VRFHDSCLPDGAGVVQSGRDYLDRDRRLRRDIVRQIVGAFFDLVLVRILFETSLLSFVFR
jgi:hypothetical protein